MWSATFKIHPKSSPNPPQTLPKPAFEKRRVQNTVQNQFIRHLGRFLVTFWRAPGLGFWILDDFGERNWSLNGAQVPPENQQNWHKKQMYFRTRFFIEFSRPETLKTAIFLRKNNDFHKIDVFEKTRFLRRFWPPQTSQNRSQIAPKS